MRLQRRFPKARSDLVAGQVHGDRLSLFRMHWTHEPTDGEEGVEAKTSALLVLVDLLQLINE